MDKIILKEISPILDTKYKPELPHKAGAEFRDSLQINKLYKASCLIRETARNSVTYDLLKEREKLFKNEQILKNIRLEAENSQKELNLKWNNIVKCDKELRELFIENEKFVTENEEKRTRALRKIGEEQHMQTTKNAQMKNLKKEYDQYFVIKHKLENVLKDLKIYEDFMHRVCSISDGDFRAIIDIIKRYQVLIDRQQEISEKREGELGELDRAKNKLASFIESRLLVVLLLHDKAVHLNGRHEYARAKAIRWEGTVSAIRDQVEKKFTELDGVKMCIWNLYKQICSRRKQPVIKDRSQIDKQLSLINTAIFDAKKVYKRAKKQIENENYTNKNKSQKSRVTVQKTQDEKKRITIMDYPNLIEEAPKIIAKSLVDIMSKISKFSVETEFVEPDEGEI